MTAPFAPDDQSLIIRDAACIALVDGAAGAPRLLMGRRHADQIFLPNKWVFPGGRVDAADHDARSGGPFEGLPAWLHPFARAAIRELAEETGIRWPGPSNVAELRPLARAITPPGRIRRYDTWFFMADARLAEHALAGDGELLDLAWFTLEAARRLDVPNITRLVLDDAACTLSNTQQHARGTAPFYYQSAGGFERSTIDCRVASAPP